MRILYVRAWVSSWDKTIPPRDNAHSTEPKACKAIILVTSSDNSAIVELFCVFLFSVYLSCRSKFFSLKDSAAS